MEMALKYKCKVWLLGETVKYQCTSFTKTVHAELEIKDQILLICPFEDKVMASGF